jgi:hypothetical protein
MSDLKHIHRVENGVRKYYRIQKNAQEAGSNVVVRGSDEINYK